jgi:low affinity Fe/Cu permease
LKGLSGLIDQGREHRQIQRSAQWGLAAMPAPISVWGTSSAPALRDPRVSSIDALPAGEAAMGNPFEKWSTKVAGAAGRPPAFMLALAIIAVWAITGPVFRWSDTWQLVINTGTTIVTFLMVFLIQNAQNRDASAIQAKLDELILALHGARNEFIGIEHLTETELCQILHTIERSAGDETHKAAAIARLIKRR